jgi:proteasome assembly chaperone (PAC2) family protein
MAEAPRSSESDGASDGGRTTPTRSSPRARRQKQPATTAALRVDNLPDLHEPFLVCAFAGWNDAAQSATGAVRYLIERQTCPRFAGIDPEEFYVFTETRPTIRLVDGRQRELDWPANDFHYLRDPRLSHDLVLMSGVEPQMQWRSFTAAVLGIAHQVNAQMVVLLGGLLADVAHTMPVRLTGSTTRPDLLPNWGDLTLRSSRYEGPTGIVGVLTDACRREHMPVASIWASVPHYINVTPNPKTLAALVRQVDTIFNLNLDLHELIEASDRFERQVAEAVEQNPDVLQYVRRLEAASDEEPESPAAELPSGAAIVEELEEFLRQRREEDEDDDD